MTGVRVESRECLKSPLTEHSMLQMMRANIHRERVSRASKANEIWGPLTGMQRAPYIPDEGLELRELLCSITLSLFPFCEQHPWPVPNLPERGRSAAHLSKLYTGSMSSAIKGANRKQTTVRKVCKQSQLVWKTSPSILDFRV